MAYEPTKLTNLQALKDTATRIKTEYMAAISKAGHAVSRRPMPYRKRLRQRRTSCIWSRMLRRTTMTSTLW